MEYGACEETEDQAWQTTGGPPTRAIPEVVTDYLTQAGFIHVARMRYIQIDASLISALVERWRPETHTFHMTQGEMTITLQDVADILGLPTDGIVVVGSTNEDWPVVCAAAFGAVPEANEFHHSGDLRISFLDRLYTRWTDHAGDHDREIYFTRAHIAHMLGCWLLADKSGGSNIGCQLVPLLVGRFDEIGRFSWGFAVLAHLFRNLCECIDVGRSDMGGCHILLQIWAWIRFPSIALPLPPYPEPDTYYGPPTFKIVGTRPLFLRDGINPLSNLRTTFMEARKIPFKINYGRSIACTNWTSSI
ncbi:protein MAIN-LIKE 2-like [Gastrolobium bilobum]|uniref:protein MAIN-LIKE 2-like n=1 Tax=Gastrolobium bilobum TaxID=150636 RepID=UPI002AB04F01|nr:protein MAIN-LIKE 2-like [Gastrolobium bilobum]